VLLVYPLVHPQISQYDADVPAGTFLFTPSLIEEIVANYVGDGDGLTDPHAWPALGDVAGLPPHYIVNAEHDSLRASGEAYAQQLRAAGVEVIDEMEPDTMHGYFDDVASDGAVKSLDRIARWLND